ncbi:hypothetical protein BCV71DRAFT_233495 [Rhizopus microsporus]|nr:hypothetical protein BCV71DRAFT_233495 [Rhizopus microsporus]
MTAKQQLIKDSAVHRQKIDKLVFVWQEKLFSQPKVPKPMLEKAVTYLQPRTFAEVIEERVVQNWCGYPLCDSEPQQLHKYKISLVQRKVFDQTELASYCSESCFMKSKYYSLQLSEEPVWFRDLNKQVEVHVITPDQDFESAVNQRRLKTEMKKTGEDIRQHYVQHLLDNIPKGSLENPLEIVEKDTAKSVAAPSVHTFDTIEGYKIEVNTDRKASATVTLKKKDKNPEQTQEEKEEVIDPTDEDELFRTMMMLKDMNMDKPDIVAEPKSAPAMTPVDMTQENVIQVQTKPQPKQKGRKRPVLSLFGSIWTMLDHITTRATRLYLSDLQKHQTKLDVMLLLQEESRTLDETTYLRGQILSERILEAYQIIRTQIGIQENMEDDIVNIIKTFNLSDPSAVTLDPAQCYMLALVLVKAIADISLKGSAWKAPFEDCCKAVEQSSDMVDACVRVLKVASV